MLETLGLGPWEEKMYLALVDVPELEVAELTENVQATEADALAGLNSLVDRGLIVRQPGRPTWYAAVEPTVGLAVMVGEQERAAREGADRLEQARAAVGQIAARYRMRGVSHPLDLIEVVVGREAVLDRFFEMQNAARGQVRGIDMPPYIGSVNPAEHTQLRSGVEYRTLYSTAALDLPAKLADIAYSQSLGEQSRVLADPPMKLVLVDDDRGLIGLTNEETGAVSALLVGPSALLDGLSQMFEVLWRFAVKLEARDAADTVRLPSAEESRLLAMLAAGMTDRQIAEHSGFSARTAQTRVQRLMERLNATTRFQAGLEAKTRGWL